MFNELSIMAKDSREAFQERARLDGALYRARVELLARQWPFVRQVLAGWEAENDEVRAPADPDYTKLEARIGHLQNELRSTRWAVLVGSMLPAWVT
jgi:hypothetical protein